MREGIMLQHVTLTLILPLLVTGSLHAPQVDDPVQKFQMQLAAAERGDRNAQNEVGVMYAEGRGVQADQGEAVRWFQKSADQANPFAACNLGQHYGRGAGVKRDVITGLMWIHIGMLLDPLDCYPLEDEILRAFGRQPSRAQSEKGYRRAVKWLKDRPTLRNAFGQRPWQ